MGRTSDANARLMDAALDLIWEESYSAVTIDEICQRAKVKKGSFYYFFDSKAELAVAALEKLWVDEWKPTLDSLFSASVDPLDRLKGYMAGVYEKQKEIEKRVGRVLGCPVCSLGSEVCAQEAKVSAMAKLLFARKRLYIEAAVREAIQNGSLEPGDPAKRTAVLVSFLVGMVAQARILNDPEILKDIPSMGLEILRVKEPVLGLTEAKATEPTPAAVLAL